MFNHEKTKEEQHFSYYKYNDSFLFYQIYFLAIDSTDLSSTKTWLPSSWGGNLRSLSFSTKSSITPSLPVSIFLPITTIEYIPSGISTSNFSRSTRSHSSIIWIYIYIRTKTIPLYILYVYKGWVLTTLTPPSSSLPPTPLVLKLAFWNQAEKNFFLTKKKNMYDLLAFF